MKRAALIVALALAPTALGAVGEFPAWQTRQAPAFAPTRILGPVVNARGQCAGCSRPARTKMQAQSATQDPPRFGDLHHALTGVVTRAERQAMMIGERAARLNVVEAGIPKHTPGLRHDSWDTVPVGHGVSFHRHFDEHLGLPALQRAVDQIHQATLTAVSEPWTRQELVFSAEDVLQVRKVAHQSYVEGQRTMTKLGQLLAERVMSTGYDCRSMVTAESGEDTEEFRISQEVPLTLLDENMGSLDLAQQQLNGLMVQSSEGGDWKSTRMVDHSIEYEAKASNDMAVAKVIAHARPSADLWRFISNSVFDIDFSQMGAVNDHHDSMFEIKLLVESHVQADLLHRDLRVLTFKDSELRDLHMPVSDASRNVELVSQSAATRKSKVVWQGVGMSIQVQTLDEHYIESELSSMAVRAKEQARREDLCQELERRVSLFKFSRDLLHWLLASSSMRHPPSSDRIAVKLRQ